MNKLTRLFLAIAIILILFASYLLFIGGEADDIYYQINAFKLLATGLSLTILALISYLINTLKKK